MVLLRDLRKLLNDSLDTLEAEILAQGLPELSFDAVPHILDDPLWLPPPRLYEARRAASAAIDMLGALVRPSWETLYEVSFWSSSCQWRDGAGSSPDLATTGTFWSKSSCAKVAEKKESLRERSRCPGYSCRFVYRRG